MGNVSDDFSTNTIANYTVTGGTLAVSGGVLAISGTTDGVRTATHNTAVDYDDMEVSFVTGAAAHASMFCTTQARSNSTRSRFIALHYRSNTPRVYLQRQNAGGAVDLIGGISPAAFASGDTIKLICRGHFYVLMRNGVQFGSRWDWTASADLASTNRNNGVRIERASFANGPSCTQFISTGLAPIDYDSGIPKWVGEGWSTTQIPLPGGMVAGDLIVAIVAKEATSDIVWPAGWTEVRDVTSTAMRASVGYKFWDGSEGAPTIPTGCDSACSSAFRNVNTTTPFITETNNTAGAGATMTFPGVTNTDVNGVLCGFSACEATTPPDYSQDNITCGNGGQLFRGSVQKGVNTSVAAFHSMWPVPTGVSISGTVTTTASADSAFNWMGVLNPQPPMQTKNSQDDGDGTDSVTGVTASDTSQDNGTGTEPVPTQRITPVNAELATGTDSATVTAGTTASDAGSGSDPTPSVTVVVTAQDSGVGTDSVSPVTASVAAVDSGVATDSPTNIRLTGLTDLAGGTDTAIIGAKDLFSQDAGTGTDSATVSATAAVVDTGTGTDSATSSSALVVSDTGTGTDLATNVSLSGSLDSGIATDSAIVSAKDVLTTDIGAGLESATVIVQSQDSAVVTEPTPSSTTAAVTVDSGTITDQATAVRLQVSDTGTGTESALLSSKDVLTTDVGAGLESAVVIVQAADAGSGTDATPATGTTAVSQDAGSAIDSAIVRLTLSDAGSSTDLVTGTVATTLATDAGTAIESVPGIRQSVTDLVTGIDQVQPFTRSSVDTAIGAEFASVASTLPAVVDTVSFTETATILVRSTDTNGLVLETAFIFIEGIGLLAQRAVHVEAEDRTYRATRDSHVHRVNAETRLVMIGRESRVVKPKKTATRVIALVR